MDFRFKDEVGDELRWISLVSSGGPVIHMWITASHSLSTRCTCHILRTLGALAEHPFVDQDVLKNTSRRLGRDARSHLHRAVA